MSDTSDNLFDDASTVSAEATSFDKEDDTSEKTTDAKVKATDSSEQEDALTGEEDTTGSPTVEKEEDVQEEKAIPVSRFKAAIKDVNDKLAAAQAELAQLKAQPAPDKESDPDGYERHMRIETSKQIMSEAFPDYNDKIVHFQEMAKANPELNAIVGNHVNPAKMAYDLAKRDMEIRELMELKDSDDWKEFQEFKANKLKEASTKQQVSSKPVSLATKVPNLNRATNVSRKVNMPYEGDELFADSKY